MKVYTTGQVAKLLQVGPRIVGKWFDSGRLKGYQLPNSHHRRIPKESLLKFLKENNLPIPDELKNITPRTPSLSERINLLVAKVETEIAYCSTDASARFHLMNFKNEVMKAINDN